MPRASSNPSLIEPETLHHRLGEPGLRILDTSWYLPQSGRDARGEYLQGHIHGAVFFDLDQNSDARSPLPHMLPTAAEFGRRMSALGLSSTDHIVVYDGSGANLSAARAWWMFRVFGHPQVAVLDGGLGLWRQLGFPLESGEQLLPPGDFTAQLDRGGVRSRDEVRKLLAGGGAQFADARSRARFEGREAEPRAGIRSGHLPGSRNVPYTELVDEEGKLLPRAALDALFRREGIDPAHPVVTLCGSGTSACAIALALDQLGAGDVAVYDGSWTEWGGAADLPIATGPAERLP